ncbi:MAG: alpha/beta fold hydrolase [Proteobacteria bacterium]|jgi:acetyl esterase/lipase|nr:alpha/beta fold hydrolase [Pseudomonadota bacterium]
MGAKDLSRLASLLVKLTSSKDVPTARVRERVDLLAPSGAVYDLYGPTFDAAGAVIAVHGAVWRGRKDARLGRVARCLAASGMVCAVPTLPGLARFDFDPADLEVLVSVIDEIHAELGPLRIAAFSYGGSYSLVAAARSETATKVHSVLAVGPVFSFPELYDEYYARRDEPLANGAQADDAIYRRMAMAYRQREHLGLDEGLCRSLEDILMRYCGEASDEEKRAFHDRWLADLDLEETDYRKKDREVLEAISPAGKLGGILGRIDLVHDRGDRLVPVSHSERLCAELGSASNPRPHRLHVTSLIAHVSPTRFPGLGDAIGIARSLYPLVTGH